MDVWEQVKLHYIGLLVNHHQPELAETFFNSVTTKILQRAYFQNDFIFVRPAVSTEYIENEEPSAKPTYRCYYPTADTMQAEVLHFLQDFDLRVPFEDLERDAALVLGAMKRHFDHVKLRANFQFQVLSGLFFRNKGAYVVGKIINGFQEVPFALPILHNTDGQLVIDAALFGEDDLLMLFSFARAYFMVDMEIPSAYVQFLRSLMPRKPRAEFYNALGLAKQGKTLFYRDFLFHMRHSTDQFRIAPGIKGMVMLVFDLPSFPFVFKVIKDFYPPQKDTTREQIRGKYLLVKQHDRVGRMADTLEFSEVGFPRDRFTDELIAEIEKFAPSQLEISDRDGDGTTEVILKHCYIERRMIPLNIYLQEAFDAGSRRRADRTHGDRVRQRHQGPGGGQHLPRRHAVEELRHHPPRQGGVLRLRRNRIHHRLQLPPRARAAQRGRRDVGRGLVHGGASTMCFPKPSARFCSAIRWCARSSCKHHADLLDAAFWQSTQGAHRRRPCVRRFSLRARAAVFVARARLNLCPPSQEIHHVPRPQSSSSAPPAPPWARSRATSPASRPTTSAAPPSRPPWSAAA